MEILLNLLFWALIIGLILAMRRPVIVMDCPACGKTVSHHSRVCQYCGEAIAAHLIKQCPDCKLLFTAETNHCPLCTSKLRLK